jgi:hypothetical protein
MPKNVNKIIKSLPKAQRDKVETKAKRLIRDEKLRRTPAKYVTIKKVIDSEESFKILEGMDYFRTPEEFQKELENGNLNLIQHGTIESHVWVVDSTGKRVAILSKDGSCGPNEHVKIEVS